MAYRTDRNNNLIAAAMYGDKPNGHTDALDRAGIKWSIGDPFPSGKMSTIRIEGDPLEGARAILAFSKSIQDWYINHTGKKILTQYKVWSNKDFEKAPLDVQNAIIKGIYEAEGGDGSLLNPSPSKAPILFGGFPSAKTYLNALQRAWKRLRDGWRKNQVERVMERVEKKIREDV